MTVDIWYNTPVYLSVDIRVAENFFKNEIDIRRSVHSYISARIIKESESRVLFLWLDHKNPREYAKKINKVIKAHKYLLPNK